MFEKDEVPPHQAYHHDCFVLVCSFVIYDICVLNAVADVIIMNKFDVTVLKPRNTLAMVHWLYRSNIELPVQGLYILT